MENMNKELLEGTNELMETKPVIEWCDSNGDLKDEFKTLDSDKLVKGLVIGAAVLATGYCVKKFVAPKIKGMLEKRKAEKMENNLEEINEVIDEEM